jgi:hypothetical protein
MERRVNQERKGRTGVANANANTRPVPMLEVFDGRSWT